MRNRLLLLVTLGLFFAFAAKVRVPNRKERLVEQPYSVQMHVHGSFSEGMGSIDSHTTESKRAGLDVLWWTDHDWRIEAYRHCARFSFDALTERMDRLENWTANTGAEANATKGVKPNRAAAGLGTRSATIDTTRKSEGTGSLRLEATSTRTQLQDFDYLLFVQRSRFLRPLAAGVTLGISVYPDSVGPDAHAYVEVQLSMHPDPLMAKNKRYRIRYVLSPTGGAPTRSGELYRVPIAVTGGSWNTLALPVTQDAEVGFAPFDGADNLLHDVYFGVEVKNGATARANFDALQLSEVVPPAQRLALEADMLAAKELEVPQVAQIQGTEISYIGEHLNEFSLDTRLPDYEALFRASGFVGATGQVTNQVALANWVAKRVIQDVHARGGVVSYNHFFGTGSAAVASTPKKEVALNKLLTNDLYGADLLEVGYRQRGRPLPDHLWVWDRLALAGRYVVGTGVSDSHSGYVGEYNGQGNTFVSWIWADSRQPASLLAGLERGRVFFGDLARFDGSMDLTTQSGFRMGDVVVTSSLSELVTLTLAGLVAGDRVVWVVSGNPVATLFASGPNLTDTRTIALDPSNPTVVRAEVYAAAGPEKVFSNPICFARVAPVRSGPRVVFD